MSSISPNSDSLSSPSAPAPVATAPAPASAVPATKPKSKPRKRVNTAEKRHQHNAIERARRETLNSKFLTLARLLPSLANHRRPSKSAIVNGSISHIGRQREQRLLAANLLKQLCRERDELFDEVNEWRKASGVGPKDGPRQAWNDDMDQVCSVEQEVFGNFASMDGDDYEGEDDVDADGDVGAEANGNGMPASMSASMSSASGMSFAALPSVNGLITPRSSTDIDPMSHPALFAAQHQHFAQPPQQQQQQHMAMHMQGINWSQDFASQFNQPSAGNVNVNPTPHQSNNTPLPFSAFMSDSTDSPGTSNLGNSIMLTPPQTADLANGNNTVFTHTPSPRPSSASIDDKMPAPSSAGGAQQWTPQQLLFLQQIQQHQAQVRQHQQNLANHYSAFPGNANAQQPQGGNAADGFTQSLIATMFPQQAHVNSGVPHSTADMGMGMHLSANAQGGLEQVQQWRKAALSSFLQQHGSAPLPLPSPTNSHFAHQQQQQRLKTGSPYQPPMLTPGLAMGGNNPWSPDTAVEGF